MNDADRSAAGDRAGKGAAPATGPTRPDGREATIIGRLWHGWTAPENADAYEHLLRTKILPGIHRIPGYMGAYLMRRAVGDEVEFITLTLWESLDAVHRFAAGHASGSEGAAAEGHERAVVPEEARRLLASFDATSLHYRTIWCP